MEDLIEIVENRMYGEARIPIIYRLHKFKNFQLEKVLIKLLNDKEVSKIAEYSLNELKKFRKLKSKKTIFIKLMLNKYRFSIF